MPDGSKKVWLLVIACLVGLFVYLAYYGVRAGPSLPLFSARRYDPFGTSVLREVLHERGVQTFYLSKSTPPPVTGCTLLCLKPIDAVFDFEQEDIPEDEDNIDNLLAWVAEGNQLIYMSRTLPDELLNLLAAEEEWDAGSWIRQYGLEEQQQDGEYGDAFAVERVTGRSADANHPLALQEPSYFILDDDRAEPLAYYDNACVAARVEIGDGALILIGDPTPALNVSLSAARNLEFMLSLIDGPVYFDEYALGLGSEPSILDWLRGLGLGPWLVQSFIALYLFARSSTRVWNRPEQVDDAASPAEEQVAMLAGLYDRVLTKQQLDQRWRDNPYCRQDKEC